MEHPCRTTAVTADAIFRLMGVAFGRMFAALPPEVADEILNSEPLGLGPRRAFSSD